MNFKMSVLLLGLLTGACASAPPISSSSNLQVMTGAALPAPNPAEFYAPRPDEYLIAPLDKLQIGVLGITELSARVVQVDTAGRISFPLVGALDVAGKSPDEVAALIEEGLRSQHVRDPQVTVNVEQAAERVVTVYGEVREPGLYPIAGNMTLLRAIAAAQGLGEFAKQEDVVIFRMVNGQKMAGLYNLEAIRRGNYQDPRIFPDDIVIVGDSPSRRLFRDIVNAATLVTTPLIVLLQR